jgi:hypothetical protein
MAFVPWQAAYYEPARFHSRAKEYDMNRTLRFPSFLCSQSPPPLTLDSWSTGPAIGS